MKTLIVYEAKDGRQFSDGDACLDYEKRCRDTQEANEMLLNKFKEHLPEDSEASGSQSLGE